MWIEFVAAPWKKAPLKRQETSTRLNGATTQKAEILVISSICL